MARRSPLSSRDFPGDKIFDDSSTRQYVSLHDHEYLTVERISVTGTVHYVIEHVGDLEDNEFRHRLLIDLEERDKIIVALLTAVVNPVPEGA